MRIIGLDLGSKTCGVATSDLKEILATGVKTLRFDNEDYEEALKLVKELFYELKADEIVIGLPRLLNGDLGEKALICQRFAEILAEDLEVPVHLWDERLTTVAATKMLVAADVSRKKRAKVIDQIAAIYILQGYLDAKKKEER